MDVQEQDQVELHRPQEEILFDHDFASENPPNEQENVKKTNKRKRDSSESKKPGRKSLPFSQVKNKRDKLKRLDELLTDFGGGQEEKNQLLAAYKNSSYGKACNAGDILETEATKTIVRNVVSLIHSLPPMSPLRQPLIQALGKDVPPSQLHRILKISDRTIFRSKKLDLSNTLLYTLKYKPDVKRDKRNNYDSEDNMIQTHRTRELIDDEVLEIVQDEDNLLPADHLASYDHVTSSDHLQLDQLHLMHTNMRHLHHDVQQDDRQYHTALDQEPLVLDHVIEEMQEMVSTGS